MSIEAVLPNPPVDPAAGPSPENVQLVHDFCAAWSRMDSEGILSFVADDIHYHNLPLPPVVGKAAMGDFLKAFFGQLVGMRIDITHAFSQGQYVMTERIDHLIEADRSTGIPVGGVFVIEDGKITRWHEYFDLKGLIDETGIALA